MTTVTKYELIVFGIIIAYAVYLLVSFGIFGKKE
jgi:hypothetical protein